MKGKGNPPATDVPGATVAITSPQGQFRAPDGGFSTARVVAVEPPGGGGRMVGFRLHYLGPVLIITLCLVTHPVDDLRDTPHVPVADEGAKRSRLCTVEPALQEDGNVRGALAKGSGGCDEGVGSHELRLSLQLDGEHVGVRIRASCE